MKCENVMSRQTLEDMVDVTDHATLAFGVNAQMVKACEELGELTTALCKRLNGSPVTNEEIVDEIADVLLMAYQLRIIFGAYCVDERIHYKMSRTMKFIQNRLPESEL